MQTVTEAALQRTQRGLVFTRHEAACWLDVEGAALDGLLKRAVARNEVLRLRRGLFVLHPRYQEQPLEPFSLAQAIHGPSYISMEAALAWHGWIPEAVPVITSACEARSRRFETPLGIFQFTRVPQRVLMLDVARVETPNGACFVADPLKALADYVHAHRLRWTSLEPVFESLRVEEAELGSVNPSAFDRLLNNQPPANARRFLEGIRKELWK